MKRIIITFLASCLACGIAFSQETSRESYISRYENLVSRVGADGLGVETLLNHWLADYPNDVDGLLGKFNMYLAKSQTVTLDTMSVSKYLGNAPALSLKDSLGNTVNYFQVNHFDDELFGKAEQCIEKAIDSDQNRLDLRLLKISALINYEGGSPDMAVSDLKGLIDYNYTQNPTWSYPGLEMNKETFPTLIQDYCYTFFKMATPQTLKAFRDLSQKVLDYEPGNTLFMTNIGTYQFVVEHNNKAALKTYNKVLKKSPKDYTAIKNCVLLARNEKNTKLEKKYLQMLVDVTTDETEKASANARLQAL